MTAVPTRNADGSLVAWRQQALDFEREVAKAVIGQERVIRLLTIAVFARGHVLLEGDVGVGKTTLLRAAARAIGGDYERVEGSVDLMPSDLLYYTYLSEDGRPKVDPGPALRHGENLSIFFFNEINRARPQVHSLLLRLMAERSANAFDREYRFPYLQVFADRNRIEKEETFELPAAARDRFFMEVGVKTPSDQETRQELIFNQRFHDVDALVATVKEGVIDFRQLPVIAATIQKYVHASQTLQKYVLDLWSAMQAPASVGISFPGIDMARLIRGGGSPRGLSYLVRGARVNAWLQGRDIVLPEDIRSLFQEIIAHRIFLDPVYELRQEGLTRDLCAAIFAAVPAP
ncbi:AAA family ATPase [Methylovirgula ligni]|uniref:MoxR-like ATPase n=1 Tax=Methylovirgula ligni TaxID=569860 RepID=A0A3D9YY81_9HYPH|nr:MoxR family ATPase [Methylovirgula ligni]QAY97367.1 AAA family ATPase [Methylovirgula ligni]REF85842.1 MoxR-like ATPase [Methylovirgula ligni]